VTPKIYLYSNTLLFFTKDKVLIRKKVAFQLFFSYSSLCIPNGFRNLDSKIRPECPECTEEYMRAKPLRMVLRESAIFEANHFWQILKGKGYKKDKTSLLKFRLKLLLVASYHP
jgi:hypothetical protein